MVFLVLLRHRENGIKWTRVNEIENNHTSGYAKLGDMKKLVDAIAPDNIIPIHIVYPDKFKSYFKNVKLVKDGETVNL